MTVDLRFTDVPTPTAIMASKQPHCLYDLLTRWRGGELPMDLRLIVSNHPDHAGIAEHMGVEYLHLPVTPDTKPEQETQVLAALADRGVELVVMARYMQILSDRFVDAHPNRIINIHHSFLPAFIGANPYRQAYDRGVKLIGATAHYATADLDEGPIIEQETVHVTHRDDVARLTARGRDLETTVLARRGAGPPRTPRARPRPQDRRLLLTPNHPKIVRHSVAERPNRATFRVGGVRWRRWRSGGRGGPGERCRSAPR